MSSAVQPSSTTATPFQHARLLATYPVDMFKALEPFIPTLKDSAVVIPNPNNPVAVNDQLITIYTALGSARKAISSSLPTNMLEKGGEHIFFSSTQQTHQGDWIKSVFDVMGALEQRIRDYFRNPTDPVALLNNVIRSESSSSPSLERFFSEHRRFNLLTGEISQRSPLAQNASYASHGTARGIARIWMKPMAAV